MFLVVFSVSETSFCWYKDLWSSFFAKNACRSSLRNVPMRSCCHCAQMSMCSNYRCAQVTRHPQLRHHPTIVSHKNVVTSTRCLSVWSEASQSNCQIEENPDLEKNESTISKNSSFCDPILNKFWQNSRRPFRSKTCEAPLWKICMSGNRASIWISSTRLFPASSASRTQKSTQRNVASWARMQQSLQVFLYHTYI